jgi:tRNA A-37 threonylcarbamoyl transferase component Bud32
LVSQLESADRKQIVGPPQATSFYEAATSWTGLPVPLERTDPLIGTTLQDTYVVSHILGEGGMGRVYEARHTRLPNKRFAIKVLHSDLAMNSDLQVRFQREAETAASVEHASVVGTYDIGRTPQGWQYMVCEHLTGLDLHTHIDRAGPLRDVTVIHIGKKLCEAVEAAHAKGVIHRDLKPHNVFLVGDFSLGVPERPNLKVLDFGLSRFVDRDSQLTKTGVIMGTPGYMSPEQAHSSETDHRTDIYGVGAILYAAATGRAPFVEDTPQMTVLAVMSREPERPRVLEPTISEGLEVVIQRAMAKDPAQRYANLREMFNALAALERSLALGSLRPPRSSEHGSAEEESRGARLKLSFWALLAFALLTMSGMGAIAGLLALRGTTVDPTTTELALLGALCAMWAFPASMAIRRVRQHVWVNSAKVVSWLQTLRAPVVAGLCAYGLAAFLTRFADELLARPALGSLFGRDPGIAYRGYSIALPLVGMVSALGMYLHRRWWQGRGRLRRWLVGPVLGLGTTLLCVALMRQTLEMRAHARPAPSASHPFDLPAPPANTAAEPAPSPVPVPEVPAPEEPSAKLEPGENDPAQSNDTAQALAPRAALVAAVAEGADGLRVLSEQYPRDPAVLKALVLAFASKSETLIEAMESTRRLLLVAPEKQADADLRYIVSRAANDRGKASELAFVVMSQHMGKAGADLLYELMLRRPELETRAKIALESLRGSSQVSPALAIAYDLRFALSCASRVSLLPRAREYGDERSAQVLASLIRRPPGCRKTRRNPCRSRCSQQFFEFSAAIREIRSHSARKN